MKTKDMILVSMFTALTAIGAFISLPTQPVPFTLQSLFCIYSGILLGSKRGALSQVVYVLLGLAGAPIFAGGKGGISVISSPTFGFILGFILCSYVAWKITERFETISILKLLFATSCVTLALYAIGAPIFYLIFKTITPTTFNGAMKLAVYPFLPNDLIKIVLVSVTSFKVIPILRKAGYLSIAKEKQALN